MFNSNKRPASTERIQSLRPALQLITCDQSHDHDGGASVAPEMASRKPAHVACPTPTCRRIGEVVQISRDAIYCLCLRHLAATTELMQTSALTMQ